MLNLEKGQKLNLTKECKLETVQIGAGWEPATAGKDVDLDIVVACLDSNKKLISDDYLVFFNHLESPKTEIKHMGDDTSGKSSDGGDDETVVIKLNELPENVKHVGIYLGSYAGQTFEEVDGEYVAIRNAKTQEKLAEFKLDGDENSEKATGFIAGYLTKENNEWSFEAIGTAFEFNKVQGILDMIK